MTFHRSNGVTVSTNKTSLWVNTLITFCVLNILCKHNDVSTLLWYWVVTVVTMAPLSYDDKILVRSLRLEKGWSATRLLCEFPGRNCKKSTVCDLIKRLDAGSTVDRRKGSGRIRSVRTAENVAIVRDLISRHVEFHLSWLTDVSNSAFCVHFRWHEYST